MTCTGMGWLIHRMGDLQGNGYYHRVALRSGLYHHLELAKLQMKSRTIALLVAILAVPNAVRAADEQPPRVLPERKYEKPLDMPDDVIKALKDKHETLETYYRLQYQTFTMGAIHKDEYVAFEDSLGTTLRDLARTNWELASNKADRIERLTELVKRARELEKIVENRKQAGAILWPMFGLRISASRADLEVLVAKAKHGYASPDAVAPPK